MADDPKDFRMIHTRDGVARIPRAQEGVPIKDYFQNIELPKDLDRAVVYKSAAGPVLGKADPVPWSEEHSKRVENYASALKDQIDEHGNYMKSLNNFARTLSDETGYPSAEMKSMIVSRFDQAQGKEPYDYLQDVREAKNLPTRRQSQGQDQGIEQ